MLLFGQAQDDRHHAAGEEPALVDLWLCGHHYRESQHALAAAGAVATAAPGASAE